MMYVSRVRTKHCDWATENRRQLDLCDFMFVRAKNIVCHGQLKTRKQMVNTFLITNTEATEVNVQSQESSGFF